MNRKQLAHLAFASSIALGAAAFAQQGPPRDDNGGPPNREEMRQRFADMVKDQLGATDEEWKTLQPKIEAVRALKRDASGPMGPGGPGGPGGPNGRGGPDGGPPQDNAAQPQSDRGNRDNHDHRDNNQDNNAPPREDRNTRRGEPAADDHQPSAVEQATRDLRDAVHNDASTDEITTKLKVLRDARTAAKASLAKAQTELQSIVTPRQEAVLVSMGLLD